MVQHDQFSYLQVPNFYFRWASRTHLHCLASCFAATCPVQPPVVRTSTASWSPTLRDDSNTHVLLQEHFIEFVDTSNHRLEKKLGIIFLFFHLFQVTKNPTFLSQKKSKRVAIHSVMPAAGASPQQRFETFDAWRKTTNKTSRKMQNNIYFNGFFRKEDHIFPKKHLNIGSFPTFSPQTSLFLWDRWSWEAVGFANSWAVSSSNSPGTSWEHQNHEKQNMVFAKWSLFYPTIWKFQNIEVKKNMEPSNAPKHLAVVPLVARPPRPAPPPAPGPRSAAPAPRRRPPRRSAARSRGGWRGRPARPRPKVRWWCFLFLIDFFGWFVLNFCVLGLFVGLFVAYCFVCSWFGCWTATPWLRVESFAPPRSPVAVPGAARSAPSRCEWTPPGCRDNYRRSRWGPGPTNKTCGEFYWLVVCWAIWKHMIVKICSNQKGWKTNLKPSMSIGEKRILAECFQLWPSGCLSSKYFLLDFMCLCIGWELEDHSWHQAQSGSLVSKFTVSWSFFLNSAGKTTAFLVSYFELTPKWTKPLGIVLSTPRSVTSCSLEMREQKWWSLTKDCSITNTNIQLGQVTASSRRHRWGKGVSSVVSVATRYQSGQSLELFIANPELSWKLNSWTTNTWIYYAKRSTVEFQQLKIQQLVFNSRPPTSSPGLVKWDCHDPIAHGFQESHFGYSVFVAVRYLFPERYKLAPFWDAQSLVTLLHNWTFGVLLPSCSFCASQILSFKSPVAPQHTMSSDEQLPNPISANAKNLSNKPSTNRARQSLKHSKISRRATWTWSPANPVKQLWWSYNMTNCNWVSWFVSTSKRWHIKTNCSKTMFFKRGSQKTTLLLFCSKPYSCLFPKHIKFLPKSGFFPHLPTFSVAFLAGFFRWFFRPRPRLCSGATFSTLAAACSDTGASGSSWSRAAQAVQETTAEEPGLRGETKKTVKIVGKMIKLLKNGVFVVKKYDPTFLKKMVYQLMMYV